jgi:hypothetical protein
MLLLFQGGDAKNDTAGLFFLLASAAILVNAEAQRRTLAARPVAGGATEAERPARASPSVGPVGAVLPNGALIIAGLAAGLALGTKLNLLAPFGLLTLGVIAVTAGYRARATLVWVASSLVTGGFWFARNLVEAGNPLPWLDKGPLPGPDQLDIDIREPHTVSDYLTNADVIKDSFIPGLHESFGDLWPLILVAVIGGFLLAILRGRTPITRMLGVVALFSGIAYLFTPLTAAGPLDHPTAFTTNLRYASPALGLGAMLLAVDAWFDRARVRNWLLGVLAVLLLTQALPVWDIGDDVWERDFLLGGVVLAFFLVLVPVALALAGQRGVSPFALLVGAALALGIVVGIGWRLGDDYLDHRYRAETAPSDFPEGTRAALAWFNEEDPQDARIAVVGGRPGFKQYVFYGDDLSNHVQYVAEEGSHGTFRPIDDCQTWRMAINDGDYDYVVIGPDQRTQAVSPVEAEWTGTDPAATELEESDMTFVFRLDGDLDPARCA